MANRSVIVRLEAQVGGYVAGFGKAATATEDVVKKTAQAKKSIAENRQAMEDAGRVFLGFGAATVAGLGASAKAAVDWESSWTGVLKTVDGTPEQLSAVEDGLRNLAKTLPASHQEIAAVAEAAGQLGIETDNVVAFTKTMIDMGESTNLSAEEAATGLARFANVMGTSQQDFGRLGASIVGLGNNFATTESEILEMSQRLAGAGRQAGLTEGDVLGIAAAMSSVGIEAEAGGSAMSLSMKRIGKSVDEGDDKLDLFAKTAGMTSEEFQQAWRDDAGAALNQFVIGLGVAGEEGESVNGILTELGITGIREADALLRLSAAGELMGESMALGGQEFAKGSALADEAAKRYETAESKIKIAWNNVKDAAIDAGEVLLPVLAGAAEAVSGLASMFGDLPSPVQGAVTAVAGITGGVALLGGALLTTVPKIAETREAFRTLSASGSKVPGVVGKVTKAVAGMGAAYIAAATAAAIAADAFDSQRTKTSVEGFNNALAGMAENGAAAKEAMNGMFDGVLNPTLISGGVDAVNDLEGALNRVFNTDWRDNIHDFFGTVFGQNATTGINVTKAALNDLDRSIASLASSGSVDDAAAAFQEVSRVAEEQQIPISELIEMFPAYQDVIRAAATENGNTQLSQEDLTAAMEGTGPAALSAAEGSSALEGALAEVGVTTDGVIDSMSTFLDQLFQAGILTMSSRDAQAAYEEQLDAVNESVKTVTESGGQMGATLNKNKTDFDLSTEAGRLANSTFQGLARGGMAEVEALAEEGVGQDVLQAKLSATYGDLIDVAGQFGITGGAAETLARKVLGVPDGVSIDSWMDDEAKRTAEATTTAVNNIPGYKEVTVQYSIRGLAGLPEVGEFGNGLGILAPGKATGGAITGPGSGTSDTAGIFALSNGEHVLTAAEVQAMGGQDSVYRFRSQLKAGVRGYAEGGAIGATLYAPPAPVVVSAGASHQGAAEFTGNLYLDSGEFLGKVRGVAVEATGQALDDADTRLHYGGKYTRSNL